MLPQKKSGTALDLDVHAPKTASGLSTSALCMARDDQTFVRAMKDRMHRQPGRKIDFVPFLSLTAPLTSGG